MNKAFYKGFLLLFWMVVLVFPVGADVQDSNRPPSSPITILLNRATSLMNSGKATEAFDLLVPYEYDLAGNSDFDYLFGVAALESGHPVKASLALERVLAVKPGFAGARVDLGRAYFEIGNYLKARQEFKTVLNLPNPPPLVKTVVDNYMTTIEHRLSKKKNQLSGWVEISGGYDSNVNYSTADAVIEVPALQSAIILLADDNVEQDDAFLKFTLNMGLLHHFSEAARSYVAFEESKRLLSNEKEFETEDAKCRTYLELGENINTIRIGAIAGLSTLDQSQNTRQVGGSLEWRHTFNATNMMTLFGQFDAFRYPDVEANDVDQWVGGASWMHAMPNLKNSMLAASAYGGYASDTDQRANGSNAIYGLRMGYHIKPVSTVAIVAGVGEHVSRFKKENAVFQEERNDEQLDAQLSLNWAPVKRVSMGCGVSYIHNNSNIPIYEYKRNDVFAMVRYSFF